MDDKEKVLVFVKKKINNCDFDVLKYKDDGKYIQITINVEGDGEIYLGINRRKDGYRLVTTE